jgi:hypothetical protein
LFCKTLSQKNPTQKRAGAVAEDCRPEFKPQYWEGKKERKRTVGSADLGSSF